MRLHNLSRSISLLDVFFTPWVYVSLRGIRSAIRKGALLSICSCAFAVPPPQTPLQETVDKLAVTTDKTVTSVTELKVQTNLSKGGLMTVAIVDGNPGDTVDVPITFIPGKFQVAALQADILIPPELTFMSFAPGPIVAAANKQLSSNAITGTQYRFLVAGLNQLSISNGVLVTVKVAVNQTANKRFHTINIIDPVMSDGTGQSVGASGTSGSVRVK